MGKIFFLFVFISGSLSFAVEFTPAEIQHHRQNIKTVVETAAKCLDTTYEEHLDFFKRWNVSKFYGDRRDEHKSQQGRLGALRRFGAPSHLIDDLVPMSCIGLTVKCLGEGFRAAGEEATWKKIFNFLKIDNKMYGTDLQNLLQKLGWKIYYWNPDPSKNAAWDADDKRLNPLPLGKVWNPVWGGHAYRYATVKNKSVYYESKIDDAQLLVGFGTRIPEVFKQVPFFVGIAHAGYHVFPGRFGEVIEAHSTRPLNSIENLEFSPFNPLAPGGGPKWTRTEKYRSGMIAIPPVW